MFAIYKHFRDFVKCLCTILWQIQHENNFLPTSKHRRAKVRRFLSICLYDCFIYHSNFVNRKFLETRRHLGSGRKVTGANQDARKLLSTDLVNTKDRYRPSTWFLVKSTARKHGKKYGIHCLRKPSVNFRKRSILLKFSRVFRS